MNAQAAIVELLLEHGAADEIRNQYGGTPLGQAQWSAAHDDHPERFEAVITLLISGRSG